MATANNWGVNDNYYYYEYAFDSSDTFNPYVSSSLKTDWPLFVFGRPLSDVAAIKVLEVQIPFSWYVFNDVISNFLLIENGGAPVLVTIPPGNYNVNSLMAQMKIALEAVSPFTWTISYSGSSATLPETGKFTFTNNDPGAAATFTFRMTNDDLPYYLGMNPPDAASGQPGDSNSTTGPSPALVAPFMANVTGPNYIYINSNTFGSQVTLYLPVGPTTSGNLGPEIAKIPINTGPGGVIYWQDPDPEKWFDVGGMQTLTQIDMYLGLGKSIAEDPLKLNGQAFSVKLGILVQKRTHNEFVGSNAGTSRVERRNAPHFGG